MIRVAEGHTAEMSYFEDPTDRLFIWRYTPSRTDPVLLERMFVQRHQELNELTKRIGDRVLKKERSPRHELLIGPRGIGKTHLVSMLYHRLLKDRTLQDSLHMVWLNEEIILTTVPQLIKWMYESLAAEEPLSFPLEKLDELKGLDPVEISRRLQEEIAPVFAEKTLLIFIENLDDLLEGLGADGQRELDTFLEGHPYVTLMATSRRSLNDVVSDSPVFAGEFCEMALSPLNVDDAMKLLEKIAVMYGDQELVKYLNTPDGATRVKALHHLLEGNHRLYIVLSGLINRDSLDDLVLPFERMTDIVTPYFQERLQELSPQQRQIVGFLARQTKTISPRAIARELMVSENSVSSQAIKLRKMGYLSATTRGRESLYELSQSLLRQISEVKVNDGKSVRRWLRFLREWYRKSEFKSEVDVVYKLGMKSERRRKRMADFVEIYENTNGMYDLGDGLVRSLKAIELESLNETALNEWRELWFELGGRHPELAIPLRLFSVGIDYLITRDEKVLWDLIKTERRILEEVFELKASA